MLENQEEEKKKAIDLISYQLTSEGEKEVKKPAAGGAAKAGGMAWFQMDTKKMNAIRENQIQKLRSGVIDEINESDYSDLEE